MKSKRETKGLISTRYAGKISGYTSAYLRRLARSGEIEGVQVGRVWMIRQASLIRFLDEQAKRKEELSKERARVHAEEYLSHQAPVKRVVAKIAKPIPVKNVDVEGLVSSSRSLVVTVVVALVAGTIAAQGLTPTLTRIAAQPAAALNAGEQIAVATYETIHGLFTSTTSALADLFAPAPTIVVPAPQIRVNKPPLAVASSSPTQTKPKQVAIAPILPAPYKEPAPVSYPTYVTTINGVSQSYVDAAVSAMRSGILATVSGMLAPVAQQTVVNQTTIQQVNMIQRLGGLIVDNGQFNGGTFDKGTMTNGIAVNAENATFTNLSAGNVNLGASNLATTTVSGDLTLSGVLSANTKAVAPYFVATASNATSTFAGGLAVGTQRLVVDSTTGRVGIGTTSPAQTLEVSSAGDWSGINITTTAAGNHQAISFNHPEGYPFQIFTSYTGGRPDTQFYVGSSGTVFMSSNKLAVNGGAIPSASEAALSVVPVGTEPGLNVKNNVNGSSSLLVTNLGKVGLASTTPWAQLSVNPNGITGPAFAIGSSTATNFVVTNGGQVGIGTTSPAYTFDVTGSARMDNLAVSQSGGFRAVTGSWAGSPSGDNLSWLAFGWADNTKYHRIRTCGFSNDNLCFDLINPSTHYLSITGQLNSVYGATIGYAAGTAGPTNGLAVSGSTGIGTTSPWAQLSVNPNGITGPAFAIGSSTATNFVVTNGGNVGIGTTSPQSTFVVNGTSQFTNNAVFNAQISVSQITSPNNLLIAAGGPLVQIAGHLVPQVTGTYDLGSASAGWRNVYVTGNVGIGTTSPSATLAVQGNGLFSGNLTASGNTYIGATSANTLTVNALVNSDITPSTNAVNSLGSPSFYWKNVYAANVIANNISAASTTIAGTASATFTINSGNATADTLDSSLVFFRGTVVPNAVLGWDSTNKRFTMNQPLFIQNASNNGGGVISLAVQGLAGQTADVLRIASSTGTSYLNVTAGGNVGIGTANPGSLFTVSGGSSGEQQVALFTSTGSANTKIAIENAAVGGHRWELRSTSTGTFDIVDRTAPAQRFVIDTAGNVGIGTTSPWAQLSVNPNGVTGPAFAIGSSTATNFVVTNGGQVGIGTTNPQQALHISTTNTYQGIFLNGNAAPSIGFAGWSGLTPAWKVGISGSAGSNLAISTGAANADLFNFTTAGNLGIGTTSPWAQLSVNPNGVTGPAFAIGSSTATNFVVTNGGQVGIGTSNPTLGTGSTTLEVYGNGGGFTQYGSLSLANTTNSGSSYSGSVDYYGATTLYGQIRTHVITGGPSGMSQIELSALNGGALNQVFTVGGTGSVTVGTANGVSSGYLGVYNSAGYGQTNTGIILGNMQTGAGSNIGVNFVDYAQNNIAQILGVYPGGTKAGSLAFSTGNGTSLNEAMRITSAGNIGIGTSTPAEKLDVAGRLSIEDISGNPPSAARSSFVFESNTDPLNTSVSALYVYPRTDTSKRFYFGTTTHQFYAVDFSNVLSITGVTSIQGAPNTQAIDFSSAAYDTTYGTATFDFKPTVDNTRPVVLRNSRVTDSATSVGFVLKTVNTLSNASAKLLTLDNNTTNLLTVMANGNVGIGTTSPFADLSIGGASNGTNPLFAVSTSTASATSTAFIIDKNGNVGIGTANPGQALTVNGEISLLGASGSSRGLLGAPTWDNSYVSLQNGSLSESAANSAINQNSLGDTIVNAATGRALHLRVGNTEQMSFNGTIAAFQNVNVGIGTTSPADNLDVYAPNNAGLAKIGLIRGDGAGYLTQWTYGPAGNGFLEIGENEAFNSSGSARVQFNTGAPSWFQQFNTNVDSYQIARIPAGGSTANVMLYIQSNGNVGIGTTSPSQALSVQGNGLFSGNITAANITATGTVTAANFSGPGVDPQGYGNYLSINPATQDLKFSRGGYWLNFNLTNNTPVITSQNNLLALPGITATSSVFTGYSAQQDVSRSTILSLTRQNTGARFQQAANFIMGGYDSAQTAHTQLDIALTNTATNGVPDATVMSLLGNGNVGIGSTTPAATLAVQGNGLFSGNITAANITATGTLSTTGAISAPYFVATNALATSTFAGGITGPGSFAVQQTTGYVGIGTTSPTSALYVAGNGLTSSVITADGGANSIFGLTVRGYQNWGSGVAYTNQTANRTYVTYQDTTGNFNIYDSTVGNRVTVTSTGSVGIGTTTPFYKLEVNGTVEVANGSGLYALSSSGTHYRLVDLDASNVVNMGPNGSIQIANGAPSSAIFVQNTGSVGIGTNSPQVALHVGPTAAGANEVARFEHANAAGSSGITIYQNGTLKGSLGTGDFVATGGANTDFGIQSAGNMLFATGGTVQKMVLTSGGNVGIGSTSPTSLLSVYGAAGAATVTIGSPSNSALLTLDRGSNTQNATFNLNTAGVNYGYFGLDTSANSVTLASSNNNQLTVSAHNANLLLRGGTSNGIIMQTNGSAEAMRVTSGGNVGIGSSTPSAVLAVSNTAATAANTPLFTIASTTGGTSTSSLMTVLANGNVGIGTSNPTSPLYVSGAPALQAVIGTTANTQNWISIIKSSSQTASFGIRANNYGFLQANTGMQIENSSSQPYIVFDGVNEGIGTTSPSATLAVQGNGLFSGNITAANITATGTLSTTGAISAPYFVATSPTATSTFAGGATFATSGGNVGIGTANPGYALDVAGLAGINGRVKLGAGNDQVDIANGGLVLHDSGTTAYVEAQNSNKPLVLGTSNADIQFTTGFGVTELMRIKANGNVGIGTSTPAATLAVAMASTTPAFYIGAAGSSSPAFYVGSANGSGLVGIGTSAPDHPLQITGNPLLTSAVVRVGAVAQNVSALRVKGYFNGLNGNEDAGGVNVYNYNSATVQATLGGDSGLFASPRGTNLVAAIVRGLTGQTANLQEWQDVNGNPLSVITSSGNLGVGTSSPAQALSVAGTGYFATNVGIGVANPGVYSLMVQAPTIGGQVFGVTTNYGNSGKFEVSFNSGNDPFAHLTTKQGGQIAYYDMYDSVGKAMQLGQTFGNGINLSASTSIQIGIDSNNLGTGMFEIARGNTWNGRAGVDGTSLFKILNNGNVGISNTNPSTLLDVNGTTTLRNQVSVNGASFYDNTGKIGLGVKMTSDLKTALYVTDNFAAMSAINGAYISSVIYGANTQQGKNAYYGAINDPTLSVNIQNGSGFVSYLNNTNNTGTNINHGGLFYQNQTMNVANTGTDYGYTSYNYMQSSGNPTSLANYVGFYSRGQFAVAPATTTNQYDFYADNFVGTGNGAVVNRYGVYIGFNSTGITNPYGIYQASPTVQNYFGGNVGIGTTTPLAKLAVLGTAEQLRLNYDATNYASFTVSSAGTLTIAPTSNVMNISATTLNTNTINVATGNVINFNGVGYLRSLGGVFNINDTNTNNILLANGGGNVGIGTSTPQNKLTIVGGIGTFVNTNSSYRTDWDAGYMINDKLAISKYGAIGQLSIDAQGQFGSVMVGNIGNYVSNLLVSGNVGIGTTTPGKKLVIDSGSNGNSFAASFSNGGAGRPYWLYNFQQQNVQWTSGFDIGGNTNDFSISNTYSGTRDVFHIENTAPANSFRIQANTGNIGIGTTSPSTLLHLYSASAPSITIESSAAGGGATDRRLTINQNNGGTATLTAMEDENSSTQAAFIINATNNPSNAALAIRPIFDLQNGGNSKLFVTAAGNVGIGSTSPNTKLVVSDNSGQTLIGSMAASYGSIGFQPTLTTSNFALAGNTSETILNTLAGTSLKFRVANADKMVMDQNGNVGIGTTTPSNKLTVAGGADFGTAYSPTGQTIRLAPSGTFSEADVISQAVGLSIFANPQATAQPSWIDPLMSLPNGAGLMSTTGVDLILSASSHAGGGVTIAGYHNGAAHDIKFFNDGNEQMRLTTAGNLGIGTSTPGATMNVYSGAGTPWNTYPSGT